MNIKLNNLIYKYIETFNSNNELNVLLERPDLHNQICKHLIPNNLKMSQKLHSRTTDELEWLSDIDFSDHREVDKMVKNVKEIFLTTKDTILKEDDKDHIKF